VPKTGRTRSAFSIKHRLVTDTDRHRREPDISPTGYFPYRTFPLPDNSPTDQIAQADKSPTGNYSVKR